FYLEQMPGRVASTTPGLLTVVHEVVVLWQWQCITVLSSVLPLFCLWVTLVHFIWVRPANADRTRIPFNPRREFFFPTQEIVCVNHNAILWLRCLPRSWRNTFWITALRLSR
ncbi:hypothetical protein P3S23_24385, partial [Enterobacter hormaechei]|nr:hypothetical protein [Enterobacter hormaechei]